jgi:hypothetical protein
MGVPFAGRSVKMIAVIISELTGWLKHESKSTITVMVIVMGLAGSFSFIRPELCMEILALIMIWAAIKAGEEDWSEFSLQEWKRRTGLSLWNLIIGKAAAAFLVCLIHIIFVLPVLVIMLILWGLSWLQLLNTILTIMLTAMIVTGFGLCGSFRGKDEVNALTGLMIAFWIIFTGLAPFLRPLNPFFFIWNVLVADIQPSIYKVHFIYLGFAYVTYWLAVYFHGKENRYV